VTCADRCSLCATLAAAGVSTGESQACPPEAEQLEKLGPGEGHFDSAQVRRCRACETLYRYRYHHEYDVGGSWDEYYLWRLEDAAQGPVSALLARSAGARDGPLAAALRHPSEQARQAAALLAWIWVGEGEPLDESVVALGETLRARDHVAGNFAYRSLLAYLRRGASERARVRAALERVAAGETSFAPILLRECARP
jgi:hypothetical protein